jgi:hypothetical protein
MKLPNFYQSESLNELKLSMGIPRDVYGSFRVGIERSRLTEDVLDRLTERELDVMSSGDGLDVHFDDLTILPDGTLVYKDSRVLLHIRDINVVAANHGMPKYHFSNCSALISMRASGKFDKYVISTTVDGVFSIRMIQNNIPHQKYEKLHVCKNCLNEFHLKGFDSQKMSPAEKTRFVAKFVPDDFFSLYPQSLFSQRPKYDYQNAPSNVYTADWDQISNRLRGEVGWRCQLCHYDLKQPDMRRYLQVHHKNGLRYDNDISNLIPLCVRCHAEQPNHNHMKHSPDYVFFAAFKSRII